MAGLIVNLTIQSALLAVNLDGPAKREIQPVGSSGVPN